MSLKLTSNQIFITALALSFFIFFIIMGLYRRQADHLSTSAEHVSQTHELLLKTERISAVASQVETNSRAFFITGQLPFLKNYLHAKTEVQQLGNSLQMLLADNPQQKIAMDSFTLYVKERILLADSILASNPNISEGETLLLVNSGGGTAYLDNTQRMIGLIQQEGNRVLADQKLLYAANSKTEKNILTYTAIVILGLLVILFWKEKKWAEQKKMQKGSVVKNEKGENVAFNFIVKDITQQKQPEEELREANAALEEKVKLRTLELEQSEKKYRHLFQNNPLPMWVFETTTLRFLDVNEMAVRKYGYSRDEFLNMTITQIRPDTDIKLFLQTNLTHDKNMSDNREVWNHLKKNGEIIQVEISAHQINYAGQQGRLILANDVTERIKAEQTLVSSEKRFRTLIENSEDIISLMDASFKIIYRSPSTHRITGWTNKEMLDVPGAKNVHPEDIATFLASIEQVMLHPERPLEIFFRSMHKAGHYIWLEGTIVNLLKQEHVRAIVFNARDVSERKRSEEQLKASEEQFRDSLDNMLEGVQIIGFDWRYKYVNESMAKHAKYSKEALLGSTVMEKYPGIEQTSIFKIYERCFTERLPIHLESDFIYPDKSIAWFELSILPVPEGIFILSIDITERKRVEAEIQKINIGLEERVAKRTEQLRKANEELEAFSYSVSHDLRAPLRAIIGFSAILEEDYAEPLGAEGRRITSVIKSNTLKMGNLIDDLLTFSRMGRNDIIKGNVDNDGLVSEVIHSLDIKKYPGINWKILPLPVACGETNMIRQVWVNIILNAAKYSAHSKPPAIHIGSYNSSGEIIFFVKDNGVGFDERYKNKLFKVFQRLHSGEEFEGTGIGLAIVEKIITKHGGRVWAEGTVDKGAAFYFSLPQKENLSNIIIDKTAMP